MKNKKAFTLVEVIMAVTIVSIALLAVYGLIISVLNANQRNIHNLQASALAAEGLEVVRYFRDSNWLQNYSWDGLGKQGSAISTAYVFGLGNVDERPLYLKENESPPYWTLGDRPEEIGIFMREISLQKVNDPESLNGAFLDDTIEVISKVSWKEREIVKSVLLSTFLSNWHD